jgi:hypothetical protein
VRHAALAAAVLALAGCGGNAQRTWTIGRPGTKVLPPSLLLPVGHEARGLEPIAMRIARRDASFRPFVRGRGFTLAGSRRWTRADTGAPLGVDLVVDLPREVSVDADLPYIAVPPDAPSHGECVFPYAHGWLHERSTGVRRLDVLVDLERRVVAKIATDAEHGTRSTISGRPHPRCEETP